MTVVLRTPAEDDIDVLFAQQADPEAARMAAFPSRDRAAFEAHFRTTVLDEVSAVNRVIETGGAVAGIIACWEQDGRRLIGYWIGRDYWGRGIATEALRLFAGLVAERPLHALVAEHNLGSVRVLEKCGFSRIWEGDGAPYEGRPVKDILFELH